MDFWMIYETVIMPELPDLEVFSRNLQKKVGGKLLIDIKTGKEKRAKVPLRKLAILKGKKLTRVQRIGKELHFSFCGGHVLGIHLMLRGELFLEKGKNEHKYTIMELYFKPDVCLVLTDSRSMAVVTLDPAPPDGMDALSPKLNDLFLRKTLEKQRGQVKQLLMDQHIVSGIGNAYADEILYDAGISPFSRADRIPGPRVTALVRSIRKVLKWAQAKIAEVKPGIVGGEYRDFLKVHNARQKKTPAGEKILVKSLGGRKTYYTDRQSLY
jgi:formamidopyrimidine-DNA glycosylase